MPRRLAAISPLRASGGAPAYRGGMPRPARTRSALVAASAALAILLAGCVAEPGPGSPSGTATAIAPRPTPSGSITPFPLGASVSTTPLPADLPQGCRDLLDADVLAQLDGIPLNAEGMGGGIREDSSRVCVWGEPGAATTRLVTVIGYSPEREARDALFALGQDGFTCYEPQGGLRCEKTWTDPVLPVEDGRTLFWRDGVIVDTQYSNLSPDGYTDAVIAALWPAGGRTPKPSPTPSG